jgi:hypothetical protein
LKAEGKTIGLKDAVALTSQAEVALNKGDCKEAYKLALRAEEVILQVKWPTAISLAAEPREITYGSPVEVKGTLQPPLNITATLLSRVEGKKWQIFAEVAALDGAFEYSWTPEKAGVYTLKAMWLGNDEYAGAESPQTKVIVHKIKPIASVSLSSEQVVFGESIAVSGNVSPYQEIKHVFAIATGPNGTILKLQTAINAIGGFSLTFKPDMEGTWSLSIVVPEGENNEAYKGETISFKVRTPWWGYGLRWLLIAPVLAVIAGLMMMLGMLVKRHRSN